MSSPRVQALTLLIGTIIGVGVFALPYAFNQAGFWLGALELLVLTAAVLFVHLSYGDVVVATPGNHQLPGYAKKYLGRYAGFLTSVSAVFGLGGSLIAYVLLGSVFLSQLLNPFLGGYAMSAALLIFFLIGLVTLWYDNVISTEIEGVFTALLLILMVGLIIIGLRAGSFTLPAIHWEKAALPYGIILFSLAGASVIPRVKTAIGGGTGFGTVIVLGTLIPAVLYFFFALAVLTGSSTVSKDAIAGLAAGLGSPVLYLGSAIGFLATITSFIGVGLTFREFLSFDLKVSRRVAWFSAAVVPFLFVLFGVSDFIRLIGLIGAFSVGLDSIVIAKIWQKLPEVRLLKFFPRQFAYLLSVFFLLGIIYEWFSFFG